MPIRTRSVFTCDGCGVSAEIDAGPPLPDGWITITASMTVMPVSDVDGAHLDTVTMLFHATPCLQTWLDNAIISVAKSHGANVT